MTMEVKSLPWECFVCGNTNPDDAEECEQCGSPKGEAGDWEATDLDYEDE
jgi:uncharacterized membrane protein YvbJ